MASEGLQRKDERRKNFLLTGNSDRVFMGHFLKEFSAMDSTNIRNFGFWFSYYDYGQVCPSLRRT
jgi:hypothetical protein